MNFSIGHDLREVPEDAVQMQKGVAWLEGELLKVRKNITVKEIGLVSQIGNFARILGDLDLAEQSFNKAIEVLEEAERPDLIFGVKLRLANVQQFRGEYQEADKYYKDAIEIMRKSNDERITKYLDYALEHLAQSLYEQELYDKSLESYLETLEHRLIKGDMDLIQAVEHAIAKIRKKLA